MHNEELLAGVSVLENLLGGQPINREKLSDKDYARKLVQLKNKYFVSSPIFKHDCSACTFLTTAFDDFSERVMDVYICGSDLKDVIFRFSDIDYDNTAWSFSPDKFKYEDDYLWTINHNKRYYHFLEIFESKKALI